jgi:serine/threonine protein kinase
MTASFLTNQILRDRYHVSSHIGRGFSDTYLANDLDLPGKPLCVVKHLKVQFPSSRFNTIAQRLFDREAEILYRLGNEHPQISRLYAHFCEEGEF